MSRSLWKGSYISKSIIQTILKKKSSKKIWSRSSVIPAGLVNSKVFVHNGKTFYLIRITPENVGYKFGEFCFTRNKGFKKKKIKKK
jgi:ribosomal protein S19